MIAVHVGDEGGAEQGEVLFEAPECRGRRLAGVNDVSGPGELEESGSLIAAVSRCAMGGAQGRNLHQLLHVPWRDLCGNDRKQFAEQ